MEDYTPIYYVAVGVIIIKMIVIGLYCCCRKRSLNPVLENQNARQYPREQYNQSSSITNHEVLPAGYDPNMNHTGSMQIHPHVPDMQNNPQAGPMQNNPQAGPMQNNPQVGPMQINPQAGPMQMNQQAGPMQMNQQAGPMQIDPYAGPTQMQAAQQGGPMCPPNAPFPAAQEKGPWQVTNTKTTEDFNPPPPYTAN